MSNTTIINRLINTEISIDDLTRYIHEMSHLAVIDFKYDSIIKSGKIYLHQTETSKRKNVWHVTEGEHYYIKNNIQEYKCIDAICGSGTNWYGGYHGNKEKILPETTIYDGSQKLCISCVAQLYKMGIKV